MLHNINNSLRLTVVRISTFEKRCEELISIPRFIKRMIVSMFFSSGVLSVALAIGILGYHYIAGFEWIDALLNASMILTGMGPVGALTGNAAKLFASFYALFSGLVFVTIMAITLAPAMHRLLHVFHIDEHDFDSSITDAKK